MRSSAKNRPKDRGPAAAGPPPRGMLSVLAILAGFGLLTLPASAAQPGYGESRSSRSYRYSCPPPLKFAAGACVKRCPAGYRDTGRSCRFKNMSR